MPLVLQLLLPAASRTGRMAHVAAPPAGGSASKVHPQLKYSVPTAHSALEVWFSAVPPDRVSHRRAGRKQGQVSTDWQRDPCNGGPRMCSRGALSQAHPQAGVRVSEWHLRWLMLLRLQCTCRAEEIRSFHYGQWKLLILPFLLGLPPSPRGAPPAAPQTGPRVPQPLPPAPPEGLDRRGPTAGSRGQNIEIS